MASQLFSTFTEVGLVDTRSNAGTITLPKTIDIPYRQISLKDIYGNFQNKSLTLNTQFPDTFEDGTTSKVLTNAFGFTTLYAGPTNVWYTTGGTVLTSQTVSSLTVSTISGNGGNLTNLPAISSLSLQSTIAGLGTTGYISTQSLVSTVTSITYNYQTAGFISSANLATLVSTPFLNTSLTSTVAAITYAYQTAGFLSTPTLISTTAGITYNYQTAGFISSPNLATLVSTPFLNTSLTSTVASLTYGYQTAGFLSTPTIQSTVTGLGSAGYISTPQLTSTTTGIYSFINSFVDPTELTSTVVGLGTVGYVSSMGLLSTASGLASYITTFIDPVELASTVTGLGSASFVSTLQLTLNITSTVQGLGSIGYVSTSQLTSTVGGITYAYQTSGFVSSANLATLVSTPFLNTSLTSTVAGLGQIYVSTVAAAISQSNLTSTIQGLGTIGYVSTTQLTSTVRGLGSSGYISSFSSFSTLLSLSTSISTLTSQYLYGTQGFISSLTVNSLILGATSGFIDLGDVIATTISTGQINATVIYASSIQAFHVSGAITSLNLVSTTAAITYAYQTAGFVSSPNLLNHVSTAFLNTSLQSTVAGLGQTYVSTVAAAISQTNLTSSIIGLGSVGYVSSSQLTSTVTSLIYGYQTAGFLSTPTIQSTTSGLLYTFQTAGFLSSPNLSGLVSTPFLNTSLTSTVASVTYGYQTAGFLSTPTIQSTTSGLLYTFQTAGFLSSPNLSGLVSTPFLNTSLTSTVVSVTYGYQTAGFLSTPTIQSTTAGLGSIGYISTPQLTSTTTGIYTFINSFVDPTELTSTVVGLGTTGYVSSMGLLSTASGLASYITTFIDPVELASTVTGLGSASFVSTLQLTLNITSTVRGLGTVGYLSTSQLTSTVQGLGTAGYISSSQLISTGASYSNTFRSLSASFSSITASNVYASTLTVDNLVIGSGLGWIDFPALRTPALSTIQLNAGSVYATSNFVGSVSSPFNAIQFYGLFGNYNNTVLAEVSTGAGTQELLLFKGSSSSDRIRLQTTGNIVFEPGSSARLWPSMSSNATPAMIINTSSNVGIQTVSPQATLDVAGTGRFQAVSTLSLNISSINGQTFGAPIQSTVQGLGSSGYVSTASLVSTFSASGSLFASTVTGLGTAGYVSTASLISTVSGSGSLFASTVQGLGTAGYISTTQLTSTVAGLGQIYVSTVAAAISQSNLTSTIQGLGTVGYVSTTQVVSTVRGLGSSGYISSLSSFSTLLGLSTSISTLTTQYLFGTQAFISSLIVNSLSLGSNSAFIDMGDIIANSLSTTQINTNILYASSIFALNISGATTSLNLTSTVRGLGSSGYLSTSQLVSTVAGVTYGYQTSGFLSTPTLTSTVAGITYAYQTAGFISTPTIQSTTAGITYAYQTAGFLSSPTLISTVAGLGSATYISSPQLTSTTAGIYSFVNSFVDPTELTSTVVGLGTTGYVSTMGLLSTASGLASYITTFIDPVELASTVTGLGSASFVSTLQLTLNITSTVQGLGTVGYISSSQLTSTNRSYATYFTSLSASFSSITASNVYASTLIVDNLQIGTGLGWVNIGPLQTVALSTNQVQTGSLYATSNYIGSVSSPLNAIQFYGLFGQYNNTVLAEVSTGAGTQELLFFKGSSTSDRIRLQTTGNIVFEPGSSARLWPSMSSNVTPAMIINTSSNVGIQTVSPQATLDVAGTGRFQIASTLELDVSTINGFIPFQPSMLQSTVAGLGQIYVSTVAAAISQSNLTSTVQGLGTVGYISTASLVSTFSASGSLFASTVTGLGTAGYISTASLVSTFSASGSLFASTVRGLGSASYLSTSQLTSTVQGLGTFGYISSLINRTILSTLALNVSSINGAVPATNFVGSTLFLSATQALVSSQTNYNFSSVLGFISSLQVDELQIGSGYGTLVFGDTQMSSVSSLVVTAGLGQFVTVSSIFLNVSTINGTAPWQQSFLTSTTRGLGTLGYISTSQLVSTVAGLNTAGITQTNITSTVQGLGTVGYISTASLVSTFSASGSLFASTVAGLGSATYISSLQLTSTTAGIYTFVNSFVDPAELTSTVVGLGTTGYVSTMGLLSTASGLAAYITTFIDPAELASTVTGLGSASFVSTVQLTLNITSTVQGLGTVGYISSAQLLSTTRSYATYFTSLSASFSTIYASNGYISSLRIDSLQIGPGDGWVDFGPLRAVAISTLEVDTGSLYATSNFIGSVSSPFNAIQFYGLFGNYNNTVLAEVSTGAGTQELLLFKGSSSSDRIRLQTTGNIVFEPGSSARLWASNVTSNATPAMIINTSSNVGIQTASPQTTLDVAGTGRFQAVSTLSLNISSINGQIYASATFTGSTISLSTASLFTSSVQASSISIGGGAFLSNTGLYLSNAQAGGAVGQLITNAGFVKLVAASGWSGGYTGFAITGGDLVNKIYMTAGPNAIGGQIAIGGTSPSPGSGISLDVFGIGRFSSISTFQTITSSIGIGTGRPLTPLDVAGTGRFQIASTLELDVSTINGFIPFQPSMLQSTVIGLGSAGYVSTASLISTVSGSGSLFASTVRGLGSSGYISTSQLVSTVQSLESAGGGWVGTATSDLNMNGYNIESVNGLGIETTVGSIYLSALPTPPYPLDVPSTGVFFVANDIFGIGANSLFLGATNYTDSIGMSTGIIFNTSNSISSLSAYNAIHQTPDFIVSTCKNSYYIQNVRQPFIQYGEVGTSGSNSNVQIVLQIPYSSILGYQAFATMNDTTAAEVSVVKTSPSTFTVYWENGSFGPHAISWNTMGNVEACEGGGGSPPGDPAYDLINAIYGNTMYADWTNGGMPDSNSCYVEQSADGSTGWALYTYGTGLINSAAFYGLPDSYYYRFYVDSHYGGTTVTSSNSDPQYVFAI